MIINKNNQDIIVTSKLGLHDMQIEKLNFDIGNSSLEIKVKKYCSIRFRKTLKILYSPIYGFDENHKNGILAWEHIPNCVIQDEFLENTKKEIFIDGNEWNENLFAVRFLMSNFSELKIICEEIHFDMNDDVKVE